MLSWWNKPKPESENRKPKNENKLLTKKTKIMKMFHFVDAAGTDEHIVPITEIKTIKVADATSVIIYITSLDPAVAAYGNVDLTVTSGKSDEVALRLAEYMSSTSIGGGNTLTIKAATTPFTEISAVAWTDGA